MPFTIVFTQHTVPKSLFLCNMHVFLANTSWMMTSCLAGVGKIDCKWPRHSVDFMLYQTVTLLLLKLGVSLNVCILHDVTIYPTIDGSEAFSVQNKQNKTSSTPWFWCRWSRTVTWRGGLQKSQWGTTDREGNLGNFGRPLEVNHRSRRPSEGSKHA